jgi:membrane protein YdbS with pleckstrin-like domain
MHLITPGEIAPTTVSRYLLPYEDEVILTRKHPAVLVKPISFVVIGLVVAGLLTEFVARHNGLAVLIIWVGWLLLLGYLVFQAFNWLVSYFVVTPKRMLQTSGFITRKVEMIPLAKVTEMAFQRDWQGRLLGYGAFIVESAGQDKAFSRVDHLPHSEQLYLEVCGVLFPRGAPDPADD